jgi:hypothetical protein
MCASYRRGAGLMVDNSDLWYEGVLGALMRSLFPIVSYCSQCSDSPSCNDGTDVSKLPSDGAWNDREKMFLVSWPDWVVCIWGNRLRDRIGCNFCSSRIRQAPSSWLRTRSANRIIVDHSGKEYFHHFQRKTKLKWRHVCWVIAEKKDEIGVK